MRPYSVRARGDYRADSDTDIMIEVDPAAQSILLYQVRTVSAVR
jgi:hypothetical protein